MKTTSKAILCLFLALPALPACSDGDTVLVLSINQAKYQDAALDVETVEVTIARPADAADALTPLTLTFAAPTLTGATTTAALFYERIPLPGKWHGAIEIQGTGLDAGNTAFATAEPVELWLVDAEVTAAAITLTHD